VHALLEHLEAVGFDGAPRALGFDEKGRQVLSYVEGSPGLASGPDDEGLASSARLIRRYHDAVDGFVPPPGAAWQFMVGAPLKGPVVCHNDLAPLNTVYDSGHARALVDWDFAAPGSREWDVAYALWRYVPLYEDAAWLQRHGEPLPPDKPRRLRIFCDAYGLEDRSGIVDLVRRRVQVLYDSVRTWGEAGVGEYAHIWADTRGRQWLGTIDFIDREREAWDRALV
jgi:hypothetical protein